MDARSMSAFLAENIEQIPNREVAISKRFKDKDGKPIKWEIRPIPTSKMRKIRKESLRFVNNKMDVDFDVMNVKMVLESVVFPNLKDSALQESHKVMGEEALLDSLLLPGEFDELVSQVTDLCGYNAEKLVEEAKN